jgi:hypothetical protein
VFWDERVAKWLSENWPDILVPILALLVAIGALIGLFSV